MKKDHLFLHGGSTTPQFFCPKCKRTHTKHSKIGKEHSKYKNNAFK